MQNILCCVIFIYILHFNIIRLTFKLTQILLDKWELKSVSLMPCIWSSCQKSSLFLNYVDLLAKIPNFSWLLYLTNNTFRDYHYYSYGDDSLKKRANRFLLSGSFRNISRKARFCNLAQNIVTKLLKIKIFIRFKTPSMTIC